MSSLTSRSDFARIRPSEHYEFFFSFRYAHHHLSWRLISSHLDRQLSVTTFYSLVVVDSKKFLKCSAIDSQKRLIMDVHTQVAKEIA
jgi:hypothetical protein